MSRATGIERVPNVTAVVDMPTFTWQVTGVEPERLAVTPTLRFALRIGCPPARRVQCIVLAVSVRVAAPLRSYDTEERDRLRDVFGTDEQWRDSLRDLVWTRPTVTVPRFVGETTVEIPVPCGQDIDLATASYLSALREGDVPLRFLFNGTVFYESEGRLRTAQIPWEGEAMYRIPADTWHLLRKRYFGAHSWLRLDGDVANRLRAYQTAGAYPSAEAAITALLAERSAFSSNTEQDREKPERTS